MILSDLEVLLRTRGFVLGDAKKEFGEKESAAMKDYAFLRKDNVYVTIVYHGDTFCEAHIDTYLKPKNYGRPPVGMKKEDLIKNGYLWESHEVYRNENSFQAAVR